MTGDPAEIPIPEALRAQYRVSFIRFQSPTAALFEGVDPEHGRTVLVKVMRPDPTATPADRQRVRRELQKLVQVRHPALVPILDLGEEDDLTWIVRPFIIGETLAERIAARGRLSPVEAATLGLHLAAALGELHRHGLLHRDLRPGHVLLGQDGGVYLIDAGLGRTFIAPDGRPLVGCPGYAAPEAILGRLMSFRSDLYGLGAVLYEALSGMPPYMALDPRRMMQLQCEADPEPLDPSVPPAITRLVATLLARDPRERPMSAQIVERQLEPMVPSIPPAPESDIELGERTVMTDSVEGMMGADGPGYASQPPAYQAPAYQPPAPPAYQPPPAPTAQPAAQNIKSTMMGLAPEAMARPVAPQPPRAPEPLDFDDVVDTNQNEASRIFGIPEAAGAAGGSAVPPLAPPSPPTRPVAPESTPNPFGALPSHARDPKSAPRVAPPPFGDAPAPPPPQPVVGGYPPPAEAPQFEPPASHTVAMDAPPPAAFMGGYAPPGQPMMPMQGQPMMGQPMMGQAPMGQPMQGQWSPYGQAPGAPPMMQPAPAPHARSSGNGGLVIGLLLLVGVAGGGGYFVARARRHANPPTPPVLPARPVVSPPPPMVQPPMPMVPTAVDAGSVAVTPDVPAVVAAPTVVDAAVAAAPPVPTPPAPTPPVPTPVVAPAPVVAPRPPVVATPTPAPHPPVARPTPPRPAPVRPVAHPVAPAADAGVATTPLTEAIRRQDWPTARRLLTESLRAHPNDAANHAQLGYVLDRLGDQPGSLNEYRAATRLDRRNTRYLHRLADLQVATGDRPGAVATLQQILRINPAEPAARARLDQLQGAH